MRSGSPSSGKKQKGIVGKVIKHYLRMWMAEKEKRIIAKTAKGEGKNDGRRDRGRRPAAKPVLHVSQKFPQCKRKRVQTTRKTAKIVKLLKGGKIGRTNTIFSNKRARNRDSRTSNCDKGGYQPGELMKDSTNVTAEKISRPSNRGKMVR